MKKAKHGGAIVGPSQSPLRRREKRPAGKSSRAVPRAAAAIAAPPSSNAAFAAQAHKEPVRTTHAMHMKPIHTPLVRVLRSRAARISLREAHTNTTVLSLSSDHASHSVATKVASIRPPDSLQNTAPTSAPNPYRASQRDTSLAAPLAQDNRCSTHPNPLRVHRRPSSRTNSTPTVHDVRLPLNFVLLHWCCSCEWSGYKLTSTASAAVLPSARGANTSGAFLTTRRTSVGRMPSCRRSSIVGTT